MEGMFEIDVVVFNPATKQHDKIIPIAVSLSMGMRIGSDDDGATCWISLADNSVWKSPDDYRTTVDKISGILSHL